MPAPAGYSGTPLAKKLGFKDGQRALLQGAVPEGYADMLAPLPPGVVFASRLSADVALVQLFATERRELSERLQAFRRTLGPEAMVWVSWPKKSAKVPTDITEDVVREVALPLGFVDVKVCAVDATWSGLKLVVRKALR
jgi:hypothetical protein